MSPADSILAIGKYPLKISLGAHRGRVIFDIRFQYLHAETGAIKPTRRGVTIPAACLPEIIEALEKLKAEMIDDGALECTRDGAPPKFNPHVYPMDF